MSIHNPFATKEYHDYIKTLPESAQKWNLMLDMDLEGRLESPYTELLRYSGEVYNGGHGQYFDNTAMITDLETDVETMLPALPPVLRDNLKRAYETHLAFDEENFDDEDGDPYEEFDGVFYENEDLFNSVLQAYANTLTIPEDY